MRFEFHPEALAEYEDATRYYAGCQHSLELRFIAAVEHVIQQIIETPDRNVSQIQLIDYPPTPYPLPPTPYTLISTQACDYLSK